MSGELFIQNFTDSFSGHVARKTIVDAISQQSFQLLPCLISISIAGEQAFQGVLLDRLAFQGSQRLQAFVLLVRYVDCQTAHGHLQRLTQTHISTFSEMKPLLRPVRQTIVSCLYQTKSGNLPERRIFEQK